MPETFDPAFNVYLTVDRFGFMREYNKTNLGVFICVASITPTGKEFRNNYFFTTLKAIFTDEEIIHAE